MTDLEPCHSARQRTGPMMPSGLTMQLTSVDSDSVKFAHLNEP